MAVATLRMHCDPMFVRNTGFTPWSDRITDELKSRGTIIGAGVSVGFDYLWPHCRVTFHQGVRRDGNYWMVQGFIGLGRTGEGGDMMIKWPEELVTIEGRLRVAQPIDSITGWVQLRDAATQQFTTCQISARLPKATGTPQGIFGLGLFSYLVEEVDCEGTVTL